MRKLTLRFIIPENDESNRVGKLFKEFLDWHLDYQQRGDVFAIVDKKLELSLVFDNPAATIFKMISELPFANVEELRIEEIPEEEEEDSQKKDEDTEKKPDEVVNEATSEGSEVAVSEKEAGPEESDQGNLNGDSEVPLPVKSETVVEKPAKASKAKVRGPHKPKGMDEVGKAIFEEKAKESKSFDEFIEKLGEFIKINDYYKAFYSALVKATCDLGKFDIDGVSAKMEQYGAAFNNSKKIGISQLVKGAFESIGSSARFLAFMEEVVRYKDYDFEKSVMPEEAEPRQEVEDTLGQEPMEKTFKVFSKELVDKIADTNFSFKAKVGVVLDSFKATQDEEFYNVNRDEILSIVAKVAREVNVGKGIKESVSDNAVRLFGNKAYMVEAFIYQTIKNCCKSANMEEPAMYKAFFEDLIRFM